MNPEFRKYRVRVKDSDGNLHFVMAFGRTEGEARLRAKREAERLLRTEVTVQWLKEVI